MKSKLLLLNLATLLGLAIVVLRGQGAGPLLPPGPPADGTFKTLQQVEPRTDLATVPGDADTTHVIDQPGSYYLSGNLDVTTLNGIEISASGATLDLMGFSIHRTSSASATGSAIYLGGERLSNVAIKNGHITGGVTYDAAATGDQFTGPGFMAGVATSFGNETVNVRITDLHVSGCKGSGIHLRSGTEGRFNTVANCSVTTTGDFGIVAGEVHNSTALQCGSAAILASGNVTGSRGECVGDHGDGISASGNVSDSIGITAATTESSNGIGALNISNSTGRTKGGAGLLAVACVQNSWGTGEDGAAHGIESFDTVLNCRAFCHQGHGIEARVVSNSTGTSFADTGNANGIRAGSVTNSRGSSGSEHGISASQVSNSFGKTSGAAGNGINAHDIASYSTGTYFGAGSGVGLRADRAIGCRSLNG